MNELTQACIVAFGFLGVVVLLLALATGWVRTHNVHEHQDRKYRESDAKRRIRDRDNRVADVAADELMEIGREREESRQQRTDTRALLFLGSIVVAVLFWRLMNYV
jgi:hypothetical protein